MKLVCITPIDQLPNFRSDLCSNFDTFFLHNPTKDELRRVLCEQKSEIIFTNPNQQTFIIDEHVLNNTNVKHICTASTGLNHIDISFCKRQNINVVSLTKETQILSSITSTAELAFCLMLMSIRHVIPATDSVKKGNWSWEPYLGRQLKNLTVGVIGFGRLGKMFSQYAKCFGSQVFVYDPYQIIDNSEFKQLHSLEEMFKQCDVISLHVHANDETRHMINDHVLSFAKPNCVLINTSRGEIVKECAIYQSLVHGNIAHYACDVLENEFSEKIESPLLCLDNRRVTITPHIGGSSIDAQNIAYRHALQMLVYSIYPK